MRVRITVELKFRTTVDLLSVLMSHEKESYKTATEGAMSELAADEGIASLVSGMIIARKDTATRRDRRRRPSMQPTYDRFQAPGEDLERVEEISAMARYRPTLSTTFSNSIKL
jgi:hypothetical protein